jgi:CelD/BcsL family acetyltransferase involved in cellulose biosynthesis
MRNGQRMPNHPSAMHDVLEINRLDQLAGYRRTWSELLARTPGACFFQSLEWLTCHLRHDTLGDRLRALVVSIDGRPAGIVPLVVASEPTRLGRLRVLTFPLRGWGPFFGPVGPLPSAVLEPALRHIGQTPRDWDMIDLRWLPTSGSEDTQTAAAMRAAGLPARLGPWDEVALIDLAAGWTDYWSARSRRWRKNIRRCERLLANLGSVCYVRCRPPGEAAGDDDPRWDLYDQCEQVAARGWQARVPRGNTLSHAEVRPFLRDCHAAAARIGAADMNLLFVGDRPVAFMYGYILRGRYVGLRMGYDQSLAREGAGSVLAARMIEDSCARGDRQINLGAGSLDCKRHWQTSLEPTRRCIAYAPGSWRAQAVRWKRTVQAWWGSRPAHATSPLRSDVDAMLDADECAAIQSSA